MRRRLPGHWRESSDDKIDTESYQATLPSNLSYNGPKPVEGIGIPATHSYGDQLAYNSEIYSTIPVQIITWTNHH